MCIRDSPLYLLVRTRRSQKIHPRASRDHDGPSLWHFANVGFILWPRWAITIHPHKTLPFTPIIHLSARPQPNSHFTPPDILLLTQSTFSSVSQPDDSQHTHHYTSCLLYTSPSPRDS